MPDNRSTSSVGEDIGNISLSCQNVQQCQENESCSTSSLGGDSNVLDNILLASDNITRPPSTVSNLSSLLGENDFVASPNIIYKANAVELTSRHDKKYQSTPTSNKENFPFGLVDISLKPANHALLGLLDNTSVINQLSPKDFDKTLTSNNTTDHDITITNTLLNQREMGNQLDESDTSTHKYKIEITIEPESPEAESNNPSDSGMKNNMSYQENDKEEGQYKNLDSAQKDIVPEESNDNEGKHTSAMEVQLGDSKDRNENSDKLQPKRVNQEVLDAHVEEQNVAEIYLEENNIEIDQGNDEIVPYRTLWIYLINHQMIFLLTKNVTYLIHQ